MKFIKLLSFLWPLYVVPIFANPLLSTKLKGFSLTEDINHPYDANTNGTKTHAQTAIDHAKRLGANHIVLNPRAIMIGPYISEIIPLTKVGSDRRNEDLGMGRLITYIHSLGMTVGVRPIFFVVSDTHSMGRYIESYRDANGELKQRLRWHGNITPKDPNRWFDSYKSYMDIYLKIAKKYQADSFTIGAELYSMTVGMEDFWKENPHGFPKKWLEVLRYVRSQLGEKVALMYDINFTDDSNNNSGGLQSTGGEIERWRYRLVDLAPTSREDRTRPSRENDNSWYDLRDFWKGLDMVGIDMYRSLASKTDTIPGNYEDLKNFLGLRASSYADQLNTLVYDVQDTLEYPHNFVFKEVGYRSTTNGFINPFEYDNTEEEVNIPHQSAAYFAFLNAFFTPNFEWFKGAIFWDLSINPKRYGMTDPGFCPIDKMQTEEVIRSFFNN